MFDKVEWEKIINEILFYTKKNWNYLIAKLDVSKSSYSMKFYYSINGKDYIDLYNELDNGKRSLLLNNIILKFSKIIEKIDNQKEVLQLTIKVKKNGNVKIIYKDIKSSNKLPYDKRFEFLRLSESDKSF